MFSEEVKKLLVQVITSWQVLAVTGILIIYIFLVNYVAKLHHRHRQPFLPKAKSKKAATPAPQAPSDNEELGLEEAKK